MDQSHAITIDKKEEGIIMTQIGIPPKLLNKKAGKSSCCIFRVPESLVEINKEAYQPRIVSIGPYHYGNKGLEMIQEHKWRFLDDMITRTNKSLDVFMMIMEPMENSIRESYSESIDLGSNDLAKMMVLDGVFLIELFRKVGKLVPVHQDDPIFKMAWISPILMRDLLKIENQIPFFVLKELYEASKSEVHDGVLQSLILEFFNYMVDRKKNVLERYENLEGKHLLDFFRKSFITTNNRNSGNVQTTDEPNPSLKLIQPATKLDKVGVKFKANHKADSFLDIEFKNGLLLIPQINIDDFYSSFIVNCMAFEQCYFYCSKDITTYVVFMGCLIRTSADVSLLSENKIIENYFNNDKEISKFFNKVGKNVAFNIKDNYLKGLFVELNEYCNNGLRVTWAESELKQNYFGSIWITLSAFAALMLLCLAFLQTFFTIYPYYHKRD